MNPAKQDEATQKLLAALPPHMTVAGARTLRRLLSKALPTLSLSLASDGTVQGLDDNAWQRLWSKLVQATPAYGTRRRYKLLLLEASQAWKEAGLISLLPDLEVPPQHPRRQTVRIDKLAGYRLSDYQCLAKTFVAELAGQGATLTPASLSAQISAWTLLALLLSGVCLSGAISYLAKLTWADIPLEADFPLRMPRRHGWHWQGLPPLAHLLLLTAFIRNQQPAATEKVFSDTPRALSQALRTLLEDLCQRANVPKLRPAQLLYFVRLDLRQVLSNLELAVWNGQISPLPVPRDQVAAVLQTLGQAPIAVGEQVPVNNESPLPPAEPEAVYENEALLAGYDHLLDHLRAYWQALFEARPPQAVVEHLKKWAQAAPSPAQAHSDLPRFNLAWLIRWMLSLLAEKKLKPNSRAIYWSAALQLLLAFPNCAWHELDQALLAEALEEHPNPVLRVAWKQLWQFLETSGLPMPAAQWRQLTIHRRWAPVRILPEADLGKVWAALGKTTIGRAAYLARYAGLRASEISHLQTGELTFTGEPYMVVSRSKRGRSRRVALSHFPPDARRRLREYQRQRRQEKAEFFLADEHGRPLDPQNLSDKLRVVFAQLGLRPKNQEGRAVHLHDLRSGYAEALYRQLHDLRYVALELGHSLTRTTIEHYLHTIDLQATLHLRAWTSPLNATNICLPVSTLAVLLKLTPERVGQLIGEFNTAHPAEPLALLKPNQLPDGPRPGRRGHPANYLNVKEALRWASWLISKSTPPATEEPCS